MKRETLIDEITANSNIKRDSLEGMGDQCLQNTHEHVVGNEAGGGDDDPDETPEPEANEGGDEEYVTKDELSDIVSEAVTEAVSANTERQAKEELAQEIVANSNEYEDTDTVLEAFPTKPALETKRDQVSTDTPVMPGQGATATGNSSEDEDEFGSGVLG